MTTALIVGANGSLGRELAKCLSGHEIDFVAWGSHELDITNRDDVLFKIKKLRPNVIFNAAAFIDADQAEVEKKELNYKVNAEGPTNLAEAASLVDALIIHISTDYVFDGEKTIPYSESDETNPIQEYGKAKVAGEINVVNSGANYYIVRTSWVFGEYGKNFLQKIQSLAGQHTEISVIADRFGRPTWAKTLADFLYYLVTNKPSYGIYNFSNDGTASWYEFAKEILRENDVNVIPVSYKNFPQVAERPKYSVLSLEKAKSIGFVIPTWQEDLNTFLNR
ncbi:dTDP-4-dehydrorhamnose reductase [Leuconostoc pseudomesenteroides]|uniref:dTDP-4-dehydrorhamnose reductase n=1 Tax=Leuconostoc pseudomesenteroides TaxID=33968 RepID=UPI0011230E5D|nr:dTDP-4-dehydrorhamnose reductase [Leuconostoc pseudomesenteroides]TOZ04583.1 dTDP-4-dehydrorhamnose reductase [Leuconostoc pseudomesenteroides]